MRIAIYCKNNSELLVNFIEKLINTLKLHNCEVILNKFLLDIVNQNTNISNTYCKLFSENNILNNVDLLLSIGGDGTLLDTISFIRNSGTPILGINIGKLGFISSITTEQFDVAISDIINKNYTINQRILLKVITSESKIDNLDIALNEVAIQKKDSSSMITIHTYVNDKFLNSYWADGLIIATPTGSTAYSLSCGGPIIAPNSNNIVITPIAPHNLTVRPIVIPDTEVVKMKISDKSLGYLISLDSRYYPGEPGDEIVVCKNNYTINFIELKNNDFYMALRNKLLWGKDVRN
ncbi:MAG TPA: NAD kinase [Bacteroidales bacterium]|nr:NAD kinase [Bacteroidales bacterium]